MAVAKGYMWWAGRRRLSPHAVVLFSTLAVFGCVRDAKKSTAVESGWQAGGEERGRTYIRPFCVVKIEVLIDAHQLTALCSMRPTHICFGDRCTSLKNDLKTIDISHKKSKSDETKDHHTDRLG